MCRLYSFVPWLVGTKIEMCKLRNSWSNFSLESLLQIAANVKIIEKRLKTRSTQFVIKFENFIFNVYTVQLCPLISCNEDKNTYT